MHTGTGGFSIYLAVQIPARNIVNFFAPKTTKSHQIVPISHQNIKISRHGKKKVENISYRDIPARKNWFFDPRNPRQVPNCLTLSCQMVSREIKRRSYKGAPIRLLPPLACSSLLASHSVSFIPWSPCRDLAHVYKGHHYLSIYQLPWWAGPGCSGL